MFILSLIVKPNEMADTQMDQHMGWVKAGCAKGWFPSGAR